MAEEYESYYGDEYKNKLDAENLLVMHMNRMAIFRDTDIKRYCSSVETLILLTPRSIRNKAIEKLMELGLKRGSYQIINDDKLVVYDDLVVFISELLEKHRMIWKTKNIKTYE